MVLTLMLVSLVYGGSTIVLHDEAVSPIDEVVYIDYTYKVLSQGMVFSGERYGEDTARFIGCEGVFPYGYLEQPCGPGNVDLDKMPTHGYSTGAAYTPIYFWMTRIVGDGIHAITGLDSVTSWRMTGPLWLALSMIPFVQLFKRWRINDRVTLTLGLLFIASPFAWWTYTYLSTDVSLFLFGALTLLLATDVAERRQSPWLFIPLAVVAVAFKITNLLMFGLVILFFLLRGLAARAATHRDAPVRRPLAWKKQVALWLTLAISVVAGVLVQFFWNNLLAATRIGSGAADQEISRVFRPSDLFTLLTMGPGTAIAHNTVEGVNGGIYSFIALAYQPLMWIACAFVFGAAMMIRWSHGRAPLVWATAISSVIALPILGLGSYLLAGSYFTLPGRYAGNLIPAILLLGAFVLRSRAATATIWMYTGFLAATGAMLALDIRQTFR